jgi:hypothetical protein
VTVPPIIVKIYHVSAFIFVMVNDREYFESIMEETGENLCIADPISEMAGWL